VIRSSCGHEQLLTDEGHPIERVRAVLRHAHQPRLADKLITNSTNGKLLKRRMRG
jgi:hypothetical protein